MVKKTKEEEDEINFHLDKKKGLFTILCSEATQ